jgi:diguanylate cyclase (GGDEF)-like protein/PAS domain S-box-containing protein
MRKKIKLSNIDIYVLIILVMLIMAASFFKFTEILYKNIDAKTEMYLSEVTDDNIEIINSKVKKLLKSLEAMTLFLGEQETINEQQVFGLLNKYTRENENSNILIIDRDGVAYSELGRQYNVSDREYFQQALNGKPFVSGNITSKINNEQAIVLAVPIRRDNKIVGVLAGVYSLDIFTGFLNSNAFGSGSYSFILRKNGEIIAKPENVEYENIFDEIVKLKIGSTDDVEVLKENFQNDRKQIFEYRYGGKEKYASYSPLGINDWFVLTIIPSDIVEKQRNEVNTMTTYLILITGVCVSILTFSIIFIIDRNNKKIREKNMEMARITTYMPGGAQRTLVDEGYTLLECTDGFLKLTGYTREEIIALFDNKFLNMIYEQDAQNTRIIIGNQLRSSNHIEVEYRMRRKDGKLIWILDKGQRTIDEYGRQNFYCVLLDITTQKEAQLQLEYEREKYKTVLEISEDILFEYDIEKDEMIYSDKYRKMFGRNPIISHYSENLSTVSGIDEQDCPRVIEFFNEIVSGNSTSLVEARIKDEQGEYIWFCAQAIVIKDKSKPIKIIGKLSNIDLQKREKDKLIKKTRRDSLTNIYNKGTTEQEVKDYIDGNGKESTHAFMIIDIDDFKGINDKLGHIVGDEALKTISEKLKRVFRTSDTVGRIGGDEFVIFAKDITSEEMAFEKAEDICKVFRDTYVGEDKEYKVSGSIGIAIYPKHGLTYEQLYKKADIALYNVKGKGKDNYMLYEEQLEQ